MQNMMIYTNASITTLPETDVDYYVRFHQKDITSLLIYFTTKISGDYLPPPQYSHFRFKTLTFSIAATALKLIPYSVLHAWSDKRNPAFK